MDGIITTFAVVARVFRAILSTNIILILDFTNLIANGILMDLRNYLLIKSEREYYDLEKEREFWVNIIRYEELNLINPEDFPIKKYINNLFILFSIQIYSLISI